MKVYILDNGHLEMDQNSLWPGSVSADFYNREVTVKLVDVPVMAVLIEHMGRRILLDLGCNEKGGEPGYWPERLRIGEHYVHEPHQTLVNQLALCGVKPEDIDTVVLSHLHEDHTGNALLFPHADLYAPKQEFIDALLSVHTNPDTGYIKQEVMAPFKSFTLVEGDMELMPGIDIIDLPGHTNGLLGLVVHTEKDGVLIFPQDGVFTVDHYGPPARLPGGFEDSVACLKSIEKVRALQKKYDAKVFFGHDPKSFPEYKKAPEYYE